MSLSEDQEHQCERHHDRQDSSARDQTDDQNSCRFAFLLFLSAALSRSTRVLFRIRSLQADSVSALWAHEFARGGFISL
jgi:hypothetical protein